MKIKYFRISSLLLIISFSSACANFDQNLNNLINDANPRGLDIQKQREEDITKFNTQISNLQIQINSLKKDLNNLRPNIIELTQIDEEIRKLLSELTKIDEAQVIKKNTQIVNNAKNNLKNLENKENEDKNDTVNNELKGPISLTPKKPKKIDSKNQLGVHLASFKKIELARESWQKILDKYGDLLIGLDYRISSKNLKNKGKYFRLKAGPFIDKKAAEETCRILTEKKAYCVVTDFSGIK